ncbi:Phage protein [Candidatus Syntrophocurvum alkaliphilum]|uniref:Phage protein n=1 Tax=Candidatus Syntrophocurvum alkaliphilum TaxID=2293317 RepID=A0A6I6DEM5_9FIRM|nr:DUF3800 domain-containing protein [Candidatus Syntrophocurvum alkaliphilum]QGU00892.1 Phage protein [Candidatus Syntrophocurvum alkaliphilum]
MEYIIYCDESVKKGDYFGNFYGGALVKSIDFEKVSKSLEEKKQQLNLFSELKWTKVSHPYLDKYIDFIDLYFDYIKADKIKIRIMFTQNIHIAENLTKDQKENEFFLLYYQFIKNAFGLEYSNHNNNRVNLKLFFDKLPDTQEKNNRFKTYLLKIYYGKDIYLISENIVEVNSHKHVILQGMDIILGSIQFRLNNEHRKIPEGQKRRGKKTIAKEKLYNHIYNRIKDLYPNFKFNIGISTGIHNDYKNKWLYPYRHWLFIPSNHTIDYTKTKKNKNPIFPT